MTREQALKFQAQSELEYQEEVEGMATCYHALYGKWNRAKLLRQRLYEGDNPTQFR